MYVMYARRYLSFRCRKDNQIMTQQASNLGQTNSTAGELNVSHLYILFKPSFWWICSKYIQSQSSKVVYPVSAVFMCSLVRFHVLISSFSCAH